MLVEDLFSLPKKRKKSLLFGVEIELEFPKGYPSEVPKGFKKVPDGSLRRGIEYVSERPYTLNTTLKNVEEAYEYLKDYAEISDRCSTHIHMDVRDFNMYQLASLLLIYHFYEESFLELVSEERRNNKYCISTKTSPSFLGVKFDVIKGRAIASHSFRYSALNVNDPIRKFGSVEFRSLQGTVDIKVFSNWIKLINDLGIISKKFHTKKHFYTLYNMISVRPERFFYNNFEIKLNKCYNSQTLKHAYSLIELGYL